MLLHSKKFQAGRGFYHSALLMLRHVQYVLRAKKEGYKKVYVYQHFFNGQQKRGYMRLHLRLHFFEGKALCGAGLSALQFFVTAVTAFFQTFYKALKKFTFS